MDIHFMREILSFSRLRSPKAPDDEVDMGTHSFSYAFMPHVGNNSLQNLEEFCEKEKFFQGSVKQRKREDEDISLTYVALIVFQTGRNFEKLFLICFIVGSHHAFYSFFFHIRMNEFSSLNLRFRFIPECTSEFYSPLF